jgi:hypothetical protein
VEDLNRGGLLERLGAAAPVELKQRRYVILLRYTFRTMYYTAPMVQELASFVVDPGRSRVYKRPFAQSYLDQAVDIPEPEVAQGFLPNPDKSFALVWKTVSGEVDRRVQRMEKEQTASHLDKMGSLKRYYRQLIVDEGGGRHGRPKNAEEAKEQTELLKLEWQRRVNEEMAQLRPQVGSTLIALAGLHIPAENWVLADGRSLWLDPIRGTALARAPRKGKGTSR